MTAGERARTAIALVVWPLLALAAGLAIGLAAGAAGADERGSLADELEAEIAALALAKAKDGASGVEVPPLDRFVPPGLGVEGTEIALELAEAGAGVQSVPVLVTLRRDGREVQRGVITVRLKRERSQVVAARRIARGELLRAADLRIEPVESRAQGTPVEDPADLVGLRARRTFAEGDPVAAEAVEAAPAVRRGQLVRLRLVHGGLRLEGLGKAAQDAAIGDTVKALNLDTRREVVGRLAPDGAIDVLL
jgi:flagella basal body P-ring formation protein FlgA